MFESSMRVYTLRKHVARLLHLFFFLNLLGILVDASLDTELTFVLLMEKHCTQQQYHALHKCFGTHELNV